MQLTDIVCFIFHKVPCLWENSVIVQEETKMPKILTSKSFEKLMEDALLGTVQDKLDHLQFAYRQGRGVDDATGMLLSITNILFFSPLFYIQTNPEAVMTGTMSSDLWMTLLLCRPSAVTTLNTVL